MLGEIAAPRDGNKQLLEQYSAAVRVRAAHDLRAVQASSMAALGLVGQRVAVVRIMAGLTDPSVAALHDITNKPCESALASRYVLPWACTCHGLVGDLSWLAPVCLACTVS